jgi:hypothetical protein
VEACSIATKERNNKMDFSKNFDVIVDGEKLDVTALQISVNLQTPDDYDQNKATVFYTKENSQRVLSIPPDCIKFKSRR